MEPTTIDSIPSGGLFAVRSATMIAKTATREELIELLRGTEEQRQELDRENARLREALAEIKAQTDGRNSSHIGQDRAFSIARNILSNK
jgi:hypothetical protein